MCKNCSRCAQNVCKMFARCVQGARKMFTRCVQDECKVCARYAQDVCKLCARCVQGVFFCQHIFTAIKRNFVSLDFHKIGELKVDIFLFFRFFFLDLGLHFLIDHSRIYSINASERNICTKEETY